MISLRFAPRALSRIAIALALHASVASAQGLVCDPARSAQDCLRGTAATLGTPATTAGALGKAATSAVAEATAAKPTGAEASIAGSETAIKDFLPRFATALAIPGLSATPKELGLRFNIKPNDPVWHLPFTLQIEGVANEPKLSEALANNIPLKLRPTISDSTTRSLGDLADLKFTLALNLESSTWGRSIASNKAILASIMTNAFTLDEEKRIDALEVLATTLAGAPAPDPACGSGARVNMPLKCFPQAQQEAITSAVLATRQTFSDFDAHVKAKLKETHLDRLSDLVNGQPQVSISGDAKARDQRVGAKELKATVRLEWSPVSLNAASGYCKGALALGCLKDYLVQDGILQALDAGHRLWFTTDFSNIQAYDFALPADSARVTKPRSLAIEPAVGYGSYIGVADQKVRLDWEFRFRYSDDQSVRENRVTSTLTFTQKVSDQSSGVFSIKWANKADYLGAVDKTWRANIGYSYKVSDISQ